MAKNDTKTIFNVLSAKARKKEITNTDRKEVRQAVADWLPKFRVATGWVDKSLIRLTALMTSTAKI